MESVAVTIKTSTQLRVSNCHGIEETDGQVAILNSQFHIILDAGLNDYENPAFRGMQWMTLTSG
jgi:hypothetical protein